MTNYTAPATQWPMIGWRSVEQILAVLRDMAAGKSLETLALQHGLSAQHASAIYVTYMGDCPATFRRV